MQLFDPTFQRLIRMFCTYKKRLEITGFAVNRFLMKLFRSNNGEIIAECRPA